MARDEQLKHRWDEVQKKLSHQFADGELMELDAIIYLIGVQELGQLHRRYKKRPQIRFDAYSHLYSSGAVWVL